MQDKTTTTDTVQGSFAKLCQRVADAAPLLEWENNQGTLTATDDGLNIMILAAGVVTIAGLTAHDDSRRQIIDNARNAWARQQMANATGADLDELLAETDDDIEYLALYTGPGGPISARFYAVDLPHAVEFMRKNKSRWYDDASDVLGLDPDSDTLERDIEHALAPWELQHSAEHDSDYRLYTVK